MTQPLAGKRIAIAGGRKFDDLAAIISKQGGQALYRPMMGSVSNDSSELAEIIANVCLGVDWFVLVTGVGTRALLEKADELGLGERLREVLGKAKIAARGYKTFNALKTLGLKPVIIDDDGTVEGVRKQLEGFDFVNQKVAVQLHGERMPGLTDWLLSQGATVSEIPLYFYEQPKEEQVQQLLYEVLSHEVEVVAFTSNTQVKFFFESAKRLNAERFLQKAFHGHVIALSVGSVTSAELKKHGIIRIIAPEHERMGAMVMELAKYYQESKAISSYPLVLTKLAAVVVIGGGQVAERKVRALLEANIIPKVISPVLTPGLLELKIQNKLLHLEKYYDPGDLQNMQLIIAATNDATVNQQVAHDAHIHNLLCNVVDKPELGNVHTVGTVRRGDLVLTVSSGSKSPALTRYVKEELEHYFPENYSRVLELLQDKRETLQTLTLEQRNHLIRNLVLEPSLSFEMHLEKIQ